MKTGEVPFFLAAISALAGWAWDMTPGITSAPRLKRQLRSGLGAAARPCGRDKPAFVFGGVLPDQVVLRIKNERTDAWLRGKLTAKQFDAARRTGETS